MGGSRSQWLIIARREFLERVRTKWFVIVTLLGPLAMVGIIVVPAYLSAKSDEKKVTIEVIDNSESGLGELLGPLAITQKSRFIFKAAADGATEESLLKELGRSGLDGFILIPSDVLKMGSKGVVYRGDMASSLSLRRTLYEIINTGAITLRLQEAGVAPEAIGGLLFPVNVDLVHPKGSSGTASFIAGYIVMFLLYMSILLYAINVMRGVILEKTSRVVEIIISAVKPRALMLGKIVGVGGVGLAQLALWALIAMIMIKFREPILGLFGIDGSASFSLPEMSGVDFALILTYFVLGFFLYSSLYAAIGAMVSSEQEATQLQMPVVLLLIVPVMCVQIVANDPAGSISSALTLFPFSAPVLMPMRVILDGASTFEIGLSLVILVATIAGAIWLAARIYRLGILLTGKRPSVATIWRWLRHG